MATKARLEQALRNAHNAGDKAAASRFAAAIRNGEYDQEQPVNLDVPGPAQDAVVAQGYAQAQAQPKPGLLDKVKALPQVAGSILTGATTGLIGQVAGAGQQAARELMAGQFGTPEAANRIEQRAADVSASATYQPKSPAAQQMLGTIAEVSEPLAGIAPLTGELAAISQASRLAASPLARQAATAGGDLAQAAKQELSILDPRNQSKQLATIQKIREGSTENELAPYRIEPKTNKPSQELRPADYRLVPDDVAKKALDQEWEAGTVQSVKNFDQKTAEVAARMLRVAQKGTKDDTFKAENRPLAEMGEEFARQLYTVKRAKKQAVEAINEAAKSLKNERVDVQPAVDRFIASVEEDLGVQIIPTEKGVSVNFKGSNLEGNTPEIRSAQGVLKNLIDRMYNTRTPSAYDVHRLKTYIDTQASYGSQLGGLKGNTDRIVKGLRHDLDEVLDTNFESYKNANQAYAEAKTAIDAVQELAGSKIDLEADYSPQVLGRLSRRILSNAQSAERVREALVNIDQVAMNYGSESAGKLSSLVKFADTLDKQFGIAADTSFAGDIAKGGAQAARGSKVEAAGTVFNAARQKLKGVNTDRKYETMNELLNRQRGAKK